MEPGWETRLDIDRNEIVIQGSNPKKVPRKEVRTELLLLESSRTQNHCHYYIGYRGACVLEIPTAMGQRFLETPVRFACH